jgi:hypothetical protein
LPASSSFVLAAARLRALQPDPGAARQEDPGSCEEESRRTIQPSPAARVVTGPGPYALLTQAALMGAEMRIFQCDRLIYEQAHQEGYAKPRVLLANGSLSRMYRELATRRAR